MFNDTTKLEGQTFKGVGIVAKISLEKVNVTNHI